MGRLRRISDFPRGVTMNRLALFVGINDYPNDPLRCARSDAEVLYDKFEGEYDIVRKLVDRKASARTIKQEISDLVSQMSPGDMFMFFFSGHGCESDNVRYLTLPQRKNNNISVDELIEMTEIKGIHRLFVLDCCRSKDDEEDGVDGSIMLNSLLAPGLAYGARSMRGYVERKRKSKSIISPIIISSCGPRQTSWEDTETGHGYFTESFIAALEDSSVRSFNDFCSQLDIEMGNLTLPGRQDPFYEGGIGANLPFWPTWMSTDTDTVTQPIKLGTVIAAFKNVDCCDFYVGTDIPEKMRRNAWEKMDVRCHMSEILALYNSTSFWRCGEEGFVLSREGVYFRGHNEDAQFVAWDDIDTDNVRYGEELITLNGEKVEMWGADEVSSKKIADGILSLALIAQGDVDDIDEEDDDDEDIEVDYDEEEDDDEEDYDEEDDDEEEDNDEEDLEEEEEYIDEFDFDIEGCQEFAPTSRSEFLSALAKSRKNDPKALYQTALAYGMGECVRQDNVKWLRYLIKSESQGWAWAARDIGLCYANGWGVMEDADKYYKHCCLAAELGCEQSISTCEENDWPFKGQDFTIVSESIEEDDDGDWIVEGKILCGAVEVGDKVSVFKRGKRFRTVTVTEILRDHRRISKGRAGNTVRMKVHFARATDISEADEYMVVKKVG